MQTTLDIPSTALVTEADVARLRRESAMGWIVTNDPRLLAPSFGPDLSATRSIVAGLLERDVAHQIGAAIVGPRELRIADRLVIADFAFRDTKRRIETQTIAVWLAQPLSVDWAMQLYYGAWYAFLTSQALAGFLSWQANGIVPATALRRAREHLIVSSVGTLTRLELVEFLKHLDALSAEW